MPAHCDVAPCVVWGWPGRPRSHLRPSQPQVGRITMREATGSPRPEAQRDAGTAQGDNGVVSRSFSRVWGREGRCRRLHRLCSRRSEERAPGQGTRRGASWSARSSARNEPASRRGGASPTVAGVALTTCALPRGLSRGKRVARWRLSQVHRYLAVLSVGVSHTELCFRPPSTSEPGGGGGWGARGWARRGFTGLEAPAAQSLIGSSPSPGAQLTILKS